jgi:RND superfamily putative drug exporter
MAVVLYRLGAFSARHRRLVVLAWLVVLVAVGVAAGALSRPSNDAFSVPGTESERALTLLNKEFPGTGGATARLVFAAPKGHTLDEARYAKLISPTEQAAQQVPQTLDPKRPLSALSVSKDKTVAFSDLQFKVPVDQLTKSTQSALTKVAEPARKAGLQVEFSGGVTATSSSGGSSEIIGIVLAFFILVVAFGSFGAAAIPLFTALFGVAVGLLGIQALGGVFVLSSTAPVLALMLGLAVGIDYALFIVSRHRQQLTDGMDVHTSIATAIGTAGSAVLFAGITVVIALSAMVVVGIPFLSAMGLCAAATVVVAVLIALTLLPALLAFSGERMRKGRHIDQSHTFGLRWAQFVTRRPIIVLIVSIAAIAILALPVLHLKTGLPDDGTKSTQTTDRRAYDLLTRGFGPGFNGPLTIVVDAGKQPQPAQVFATVRKLLAGVKDVAAVTPAIPNSTGRLAIINVTPVSGPSSEKTNDLVKLIRARAAPARKIDGVDVLVTGRTALNIDVSSKLNSALPLFLAVVVGLALLLLLAVFRSIAVPIKAVAGFLLTIAAATGVVVWVFQDGHLGSLVNADAPSPIISFLPILMIAILFGLAMDYEVFLVSRMRESYTQTHDAHHATIAGFQASARVVTAAGLIMIGVFGGFVLAPDPTTKQIGLALAFGVLIDAFIVRMTIVPAVLAVLGDRAWALPHWLDRHLPHLDIEGDGLKHRDAATQVPREAQPTTG